ncbi:MAG TPA: hypothetical protein P5180_14945 [Bacteroidales bacterium]|nr:hypothetical protein [Bacteroidales bacterium]
MSISDLKANNQIVSHGKALICIVAGPDALTGAASSGVRVLTPALKGQVVSIRVPSPAQAKNPGRQAGAFYFHEYRQQACLQEVRVKIKRATTVAFFA